MFKHGQIVLVDTNVIIEAHRTRCLSSLSNYFELHTVDKVVEETQTGYQNRRPEQNIDLPSLRAQLRHVATVTDAERAQFSLDHPTVTLDPGERDLLIYAKGFKSSDVWLLNSPDMAAVRYAHQQKWIDRLVSLESMNAHLNCSVSESLRENYTEGWLSRKRTQLVLGC